MSPRKPTTEAAGTAGTAPPGAEPGAETPSAVERPARPGPLTAPGVDELADVAELSYEDARDELTRIVSGLEGGQVPLEESMRMWRRGEALAAHCTSWLDGAQRQIEDATSGRAGSDGSRDETDDPADDDEG